MHSWHRAALRLLMLLLAVAAVGCGPAEPEWQEATSASGNYVAEFPAKPTTRTIDGLLFYRDDAIVHAKAVYDDESDSASADRFLSSLASQPA
jgi:hypothetical protein